MMDEKIYKIVQCMLENQANIQKALLEIQACLKDKATEKERENVVEMPYPKDLGLHVVLIRAPSNASSSSFKAYKAHVGMVRQLKDGILETQNVYYTIHSGFISPEIFQQIAIAGPSLFERTYGWKWEEWFHASAPIRFAKEDILASYKCNIENWTAVYGILDWN